VYYCARGDVRVVFRSMVDDTVVSKPCAELYTWIMDKDLCYVISNARVWRSRGVTAGIRINSYPAGTTLLGIRGSVTLGFSDDRSTRMAFVYGMALVAYAVFGDMSNPSMGRIMEGLMRLNDDYIFSDP
jgi:hypothetical protein